MTRDAIVVGGGHNGLIAAAYMAQAGMTVTVLERRSTVGGCASTVDDLDARFNICNCDHTAIRTTSIVDELDLGRHGLEYLDVEPAMIHTTWDDHRPWASFHDVDATLEILAATHPDEVDGYRRYLDDARPVVDLLTELATTTPDLRHVTKRILDARGRGLTTLLRWSRRTARSVLEDYFTSDALIAPAIATGPMVWGITGDTPGTGLAAASYAMRHVAPIGRPVGGSGSLPEALAAAVRHHGGHIVTDANVVAVHCEADRVRSVELQDGSVLEAPVVMSACDPTLLFVHWLRNAPDGASKVVDRWRNRPAHDGYESKIDAVVTELPHMAALDDPAIRDLVADSRAPTTTVAPNPSAIADAHAAMGRGQIVDQPMFLVNTPTVADASLRPADGSHVFSLEVVYTPYDLAGGWDNSTEPDRWMSTFAALAQPGWLDHVDRWRAMTPPVYERDFHMRRGHAVSYSGSPVASLLGREPELTRYRTPVAGLYQTGAATYPGAGVWGASGRNAAQAVLRDR